MLRCDNPSLITFFFILRLTLLLPQAYLGTMHQTSILFHFLVSVFLFVFVLCLCWSFVFAPMFVFVLVSSLIDVSPHNAKHIRAVPQINKFISNNQTEYVKIAPSQYDWERIRCLSQLRNITKNLSYSDSEPLLLSITIPLSVCSNLLVPPVYHFCFLQLCLYPLSNCCFFFLFSLFTCFL